MIRSLQASPSPLTFSESPRARLTEEQIHWLKSVKFHAESGSTESRKSLQELASKDFDTSNPLLLRVLDLIKTMPMDRLTNLAELLDSSREALHSVLVISPALPRYTSPRSLTGT